MQQAAKIVTKPRPKGQSFGQPTALIQWDSIGIKFQLERLQMELSLNKQDPTHGPSFDKRSVGGYYPKSCEKSALAWGVW